MPICPSAIYSMKNTDIIIITIPKLQMIKGALLKVIL
jgi:hypothetical protein